MVAKIKKKNTEKVRDPSFIIQAIFCFYFSSWAQPTVPHHFSKEFVPLLA